MSNDDDNSLGKMPFSMEEYFGIQKFLAKEYKEALEFLLKSMEKTPNMAGALTILECYKKLGKYDSAIELGESFLKIEPNSSFAYLFVGEAYAELGNKVKSEEYLKKALTLFIKEFEENPEVESILNTMAWINILLGNYEESIKYSEKAIKFAKSDMIHHNYHSIGYALERMKKYTEAIDYFKIALEHEPTHPDSCFDMGECYEQLDNLPEAVKWIEKSVQLSPQWKKLSDKLTELKKRLVAHELAINNAEKINKNPKIVHDSYTPSAGVSFEQRNDIFQQNNDVLPQNKQSSDSNQNSTALPKDDNFTEYIKEGDRYLEEKNYFQAYKFFEKAYQLNPNNVEVLIKMGDVKMADEDPKTALFQYAKALKLQPNMPGLMEKKKNASSKLREKTDQKYEDKIRLKEDVSGSSNKYSCIRCKTEYDIEPFICPRCGFSRSLAEQAVLSRMNAFENMMMDHQKTFNDFFDEIDNKTLNTDTLVKVLNYMKKDSDLINSILTKSASKEESGKHEEKKNIDIHENKIDNNKLEENVTDLNISSDFLNENTDKCQDFLKIDIKDIKFQDLLKSRTINFGDILKALKIAENTGDQVEILIISYNLGKIYKLRADYAKSLESYEKALKLCTKLNENMMKALVLTDIGSLFVSMRKLDESLEKFKIALSIAEKEGNMDLKGLVFNSFGCVYMVKKQWQESMKFFKQALEANQNDKNKIGIALTYSNIGNLYQEMGDLENSLKNFTQSMEIAPFIGATSGIRLNNIGGVYYSLGQYNKSLEFLFKGLEINERTGNVSALSYSYKNIANTYHEIGDLESALPYYEKALQMHERLNDQREISYDICSIGIVYQYRRDYVRALQKFQESLVIAKKIGDKAHIANCYSNIAQNYVEQKDYNQAMKCYQEALKANEKTDDIEGKAIFLCNMGTTYAYMGKPKEGLSYLKQSVEILTKIHNPLVRQVQNKIDQIRIAHNLR